MPETLVNKKEIPEQQPFEKQAEKSLVEMNREMGEFLGELDTLEKNAENAAGEEGEKLREELKNLRKEVVFSADWWAGNIYAFTELVVGDGINFPAVETLRQAQGKEETFEEIKERAKKELAENGITSEQARTYNPVNAVLKRGIVPFDYRPKNKIKELIPNLIFGSEDLKFSDVSAEKVNSRQDAWRLYLGIPQKNDTFGISDYQPNKEKGDGEGSVEPYCFKLKTFWEKYLEGGFSYVNATLSAYHSFVVSLLIENIQKAGGVFITDDVYVAVMGAFSFHLGEDEQGKYIAYSDVWDLNVFPENEKGFFGKPFHIYDRLYYDPETYEPLLR
jgi:hypothetical protein